MCFETLECPKRQEGREVGQRNWSAEACGERQTERRETVRRKSGQCRGVFVCVFSIRFSSFLVVRYPVRLCGLVSLMVFHSNSGDSKLRGDAEGVLKRGVAKLAPIGRLLVVCVLWLGFVWCVMFGCRENEELGGMWSTEEGIGGKFRSDGKRVW